MQPRRILFGLVAAWLLTAGGPATAADSLALGGEVATPRRYTAAELALLPQATQPVTYLSGRTPRSDRFTGPLLWDVVQGAGGVTVDPAHNGLLRGFVVATGGDGYQAVISLGEIAPGFGNRPVQVATGAASGTLPGADGFARLAVPGDVRGGRYVSDLAALRVGIAPLQPGSGGGRSSRFVVQGSVATPRSWGLAALQALTPHRATLTSRSGPTSVTETFTGALLWEVLSASGILTDTAIRGDILRRIVVATGSDGYQAVFALGEIAPEFGNAPVLVAYADSSGPLAAGGFARLIVPRDVRRGRHAFGLISFTILDASAPP